MTDSILDTIKKMLGLASDYDAFDTDLIVHINSVFMTLQQLAVGPAEGFSITGPTETWTNFLAPGVNLAGVKSYVFIKVRILFDPPTSSFVLDSLGRQAAEFEWRSNIQAEPAPPIVSVVEEDYYD
jgi:hypothetical protein